MSSEYHAEHLIQIRVYYEDTDLAGIVYYANYLRFIERGRTELLREAGVEQSRLRAETGLIFVVRRCCVDYLKPARFDDLLEVSTRIVKLRGASLDMRQEVRRGAEVLTRVEVLIACLDGEGAPARLPETLRALSGR